MSKAKKPAKKPKAAKPAATSPAESLPVCIAMVICEQVIEAKDNTISAIRIVDTLNLPPTFEHELGEGVEFGQLRLLMVIKKGYSSGKSSLLLTCSGPNVEKEPVGIAPDATFEGGPEAGSNLPVPLRIHWGGEGVYWLELLAGDSLLARTPLKINGGKIKPSGSAGKESPDQETGAKQGE